MGLLKKKKTRIFIRSNNEFFQQVPLDKRNGPLQASPRDSHLHRCGKRAHRTFPCSFFLHSAPRTDSDCQDGTVVEPSSPDPRFENFRALRPAARATDRVGLDTRGGRGACSVRASEPGAATLEDRHSNQLRLQSEEPDPRRRLPTNRTCSVSPLASWCPSRET